MKENQQYILGEIQCRIEQSRNGQISRINETLLDSTPLIWAIKYRLPQLVQTLLDLDDIDVNAVKEYGITALHAACYYMYDDIIPLLLLYGANPNAVTVHNETPLHYLTGHHSRAHRNPNNAGPIPRIVLNLMESGAEINYPKSSVTGFTPHDIFQQGFGSTGAPAWQRVNAYIADQTALFQACHSYQPYLPADRLLQPKYANSRMADGSTVLMVAAARNNLPLVKALVVAGADVNATDATGSTALHCAAQMDARDAMDSLIAHRADIEAVDQRGYRPLHEAAAFNCSHAARTLIAKGAQISARNLSGATPVLTAASHRGTTNVLLYFFSLQATGQLSLADITTVDDKSMSVLHYLCSYQRIIPLQELAQAFPHGLQPEHPNNRGETALDLAGNDPTILGILRQHVQNTAAHDRQALDRVGPPAAKRSRSEVTDDTAARNDVSGQLRL